jgi:hypothetical protein
MIIAKERRLEKNCTSQNNDGLHQCVVGGEGGVSKRTRLFTHF